MVSSYEFSRKNLDLGDEKEKEKPDIKGQQFYVNM